MIKFEKVSFAEYYSARRRINPIIDDLAIREEYDNIKLPQRSTSGSAGYDFYAPYSIKFESASNDCNRADVLFPTGIRWITDRDDVVLMCYPRSGLGFKYGIRLLNTTGVIDSDYWKSDNEGHILCKMTSKYNCEVEQGKGFMQGIIVPFYKTDDDVSDGERNGGFGSTDKK